MIDAPISSVATRVYRVPTERPEADGTLAWEATVAVVAEVGAAGVSGLGWTYSTAAAAGVINEHLADAIRGTSALDPGRCAEAMRRACRNIGSRGLAAQAISAVDIAVWDLKAKLLDIPLAELLGRVIDEVPVYGSGGFTTMSEPELAEQVEGWLGAGCQAVKIKIGESWGSREERDLDRVAQLRKLTGDDVTLMVDANGGYGRGQARRVGRALDELGVMWFEEPVSSDDVEGLGLVRDSLTCDVAAGEYAGDVFEVARLCPVVDCLQLDVTRCGGYTGWLAGAAIAASYNLDVSGHCAPTLHLPVAVAVPRLRHVEWFADHARLEPMLFDGVPAVKGGAMKPSQDSGHGARLLPDAEKWRIS